MVADLFHLKNILGSTEQICEDLIEFVEPEPISFSKTETYASDLSNKTANSYSLCHFNTETGKITPIFLKDCHKRV